MKSYLPLALILFSSSVVSGENNPSILNQWLSLQGGLPQSQAVIFPALQDKPAQKVTLETVIERVRKVKAQIEILDTFKSTDDGFAKEKECFRLRKEFLAAIQEAAKWAPGDDRVKSMARWGSDTSVYWWGGFEVGRTLSKRILETEEYDDLRLNGDLQLLVMKAQILHGAAHSFLIRYGPGIDGYKEGIHLQESPFYFSAYALGSINWELMKKAFEELVVEMPVLKGTVAAGFGKEVRWFPKEVRENFGRISGSFNWYLYRVARLDKNSAALKEMAQWGKNTKVFLTPQAAEAYPIISEEKYKALGF